MVGTRLRRLRVAVWRRLACERGTSLTELLSTLAILGLIVGALIPPSLRMSANTQGMPVLDALMMGRFETAMLTSFLLSILGTMVGVWIGGKNLIPRNLKERYRP